MTKTQQTATAKALSDCYLDSMSQGDKATAERFIRARRALLDGRKDWESQLSA